MEIEATGRRQVMRRWINGATVPSYSEAAESTVTGGQPFLVR
jgi:hypothetical protein